MRRHTYKRIHVTPGSGKVGVCVKQCINCGVTKISYDGTTYYYRNGEREGRAAGSPQRNRVPECRETDKERIKWLEHRLTMQTLDHRKAIELLNIDWVKRVKRMSPGKTPPKLPDMVVLQFKHHELKLIQHPGAVEIEKYVQEHGPIFTYFAVYKKPEK